MAHCTELGLREVEWKEFGVFKTNWNQWCSECSSWCLMHCTHWNALLPRSGHNWRKLTQERLDEDDLRPGSVFIARAGINNLFCVGYLPANDQLRAFHQCADVIIKDMWCLPPTYGSKRIVDMVRRKYAEKYSARTRKVGGCTGGLCVWLDGTIDELMTCVLSIYIWMTRQPYDLQSGAPKDSRMLYAFKSLRSWHDFIPCDPAHPLICVVPPFSQSAKEFSLARSERLKAINIASTVEKATQCTAAEISSENTPPTSTAETAPPTPPQDANTTAEEKLVLKKPTFTGLAESMNKLNMSDLTPPSSPDRLSFGMGEFLKNANVDFRWLGEGKGTTCNISIHIPPGGDLPVWLKDRAS